MCVAPWWQPSIVDRSLRWRQCGSLVGYNGVLGARLAAFSLGVVGAQLAAYSLVPYWQLMQRIALDIMSGVEQNK